MTKLDSKSEFIAELASLMLKVITRKTQELISVT